jgi:hypothetical protein
LIVQIVAETESGFEKIQISPQIEKIAFQIDDLRHIITPTKIGMIVFSTAQFLPGPN